jgi:putative toxin-antitoxin system antitoxin component (TIGR02293 family)
MMTFVSTRPPPTMPGTSLLGLKANSIIELGDAVEEGFKPEVLTRFADHLELSLGEALQLLDIKESTYHLYKRTKRRLNRDDSANLYQLAQVTEAAEAYFEDRRRARTWLQTPRSTFGQKTPLQFALLPGGAEYVTTVLSRLEHGVYL